MTGTAMHKKGRPKRKIVIRQRRAHKHIDFMMRLYIEGHTFKDIAAQMQEVHSHKISHVQVFTRVKQELADWQERRDDFIESYKIVELEKLNRVENEYWKAWYRSQKEATETMEKTIGKGEAAVLTEEGTKVKQRDGSSSFLQGIERCIAQRCQILGLYAPAKVDERKIIRIIYD